MTDKMPREEIIRRLRVLGTAKMPLPEEDHWLGNNIWLRGIADVATAAADLLEAPGPKTRKEALESLPKLRDDPGLDGWLLDSLEALGLLKWRP